MSRDTLIFKNLKIYNLEYINHTVNFTVKPLQNDTSVNLRDIFYELSIDSYFNFFFKFMTGYTILDLSFKIDENNSIIYVTTAVLSSQDALTSFFKTKPYNAKHTLDKISVNTVIDMNMSRVNHDEDCLPVHDIYLTDVIYDSDQEIKSEEEFCKYVYTNLILTIDKRISERINNGFIDAVFSHSFIDFEVVDSDSIRIIVLSEMVKINGVNIINVRDKSLILQNMNKLTSEIFNNITIKDLFTNIVSDRNSKIIIPVEIQEYMEDTTMNAYGVDYKILELRLLNKKPKYKDRTVEDYVVNVGLVDEIPFRIFKARSMFATYKYCGFYYNMTHEEFVSDFKKLKGDKHYNIVTIESNSMALFRYFIVK